MRRRVVCPRSHPASPPWVLRLCLQYLPGVAPCSHPWVLRLCSQYLPGVAPRNPSGRVFRVLFICCCGFCCPYWGFGGGGGPGWVFLGLGGCSRGVCRWM